MPRFRLSVGRGMVVVALLAVLMAAVRGNSEHVAAALNAIAVASLAFATLGAIVRCEGQRARWVGYATFGWTYYLALFVRDQTYTKLFPDDLVAELTRFLGMIPFSFGNQTDETFPAYRIVRWSVLIAFAYGGSALGPILARARRPEEAKGGGVA